MQALGKIFVCGIGKSAETCLLKIKNSHLIISRGLLAENWLKEHEIISDVNLVFNSADLIQACVERVEAALSQGLDVCYVTPVSPFQLDQNLQILTSQVQSKNINSVSGTNIMDLLPLNVYKESKLLTIDALLVTNSHHPPISSDENVMIFEPFQVPNLCGLLSRIYLPETRVYIYGAEHGDQEEWGEIRLSELDGSGAYLAALFIPAQSQNTSLESFEGTIAHLRSPQDGCPWDKKQTHASLRTYLLEETYETLDALDRSDIPALQEELGDLLLQILLHAEIAIESGEFSMRDVINGINRKLIYRHPHVFKDWKVKDDGEVVQNWEALKEQERDSQNGDDKNGMLDSIPLSFPALAQAQAIQGRAARVGFDWPTIEPVLEKVAEELQEIRSAADDEERADELGDLLFSIVNVIRWLNVDAETALRQTNQKFRMRFHFIEERALQNGKKLRDMTLEEMDMLWDEAKKLDG